MDISANVTPADRTATATLKLPVELRFGRFIVHCEVFPRFDVSEGGEGERAHVTAHVWLAAVQHFPHDKWIVNVSSWLYLKCK